MKQFCFVLILATAILTPALPQRKGSPFAGRWDITITTPNATYPDWMEVAENDGKPAVRIQPRSGSVRPVNDFKLDGSKLTLTINAASDTRPATTWELSVKGDQFTGTIQRGDTVQGRLAGVRAPALNRQAPKAWTDPEPLFNGKDLSGWEPDNPANNRWVARDGVLLNESKGANLKTTRKFDDFKLHIEFNCPAEGNSGVYLRGRYEIQVEYEAPGTEDKFHSMGSIYGFVAPAAELPRKPGEWESFDVTLIGRHVTIVRNGVKTVDNQEIPGITGGALDSNEGQPGPFYIQGDHTGGMMYRNITISVSKQ